MQCVLNYGTITIMANFHSHIKVISRGAGRNAIAAAAYRRAAKMKDNEEDKMHNYTKKGEVVFSDICIPEDSPDWVKEIGGNREGENYKSSEILWNKVEKFEKRIDAQLARELEFSLPVELTLEQNLELAKNYIEKNIVSRGMIADWSYHNKDGNPHVHVMMPTRKANDTGFGLKERLWNSRTVTNELREALANDINCALQKHGFDARVDHRSYKELGIELTPQVHLGAVEKMSDRNIKTEIMSIYMDINSQNLTIIADNPHALLSKINIQKSTFNYDDVASNLYNYTNSKSSIIEVDPALFAKQNTSIEFLTKAKIARILQTIEYHDSVFTTDKIEKELKDLTTNYKQLARAIVQVKNADNVISLGFGDDGKERFTTANMLSIERNIQSDVAKLKNNIFALIPDKTIDKVLSDYELFTGKKLTEEQDNAVRHIVGKESISCIVGRAGTGKSFSLAAAKSIWDNQGNEVFGVALSGIASDGLVKDANMNSRTIASFLLSVENSSIKLSNNSVIVMDEAGMTDSLSMQKVIRLTEEAGAKLVLVGDPAQLQPVGPGASFRAILEKTGFAEIQTVYRQKEEWQRQATVKFSQANTAEAVQSYYDNGCVFMLGSSNEAINKLTEDWGNLRANSNKDISKYLVIAHRNADVQLLNSTLRNMRAKNSELSEGYTVKNIVSGEEREIKIAQNDRIVFLKNDKKLGVANGRFATITYVNYSESGKVIDFNVKLDGNDKELTINPTSYNNFDYGYAATVHKTQGVTVDHSFVYGGGNLNSSLTYVAMTRHKETTGFYASTEQYKTINVLKDRVSRLDVKDSVLNYLDDIDDYAGRRGIETSQKTLKQIIVDGLRRAKDSMITAITGNERVESQGTEQQQEPVKATIDKEYAKLVGEYAMSRKQFGMVYSALKPKLEALGYDKIPTKDHQAMEIISKFDEYQDFIKLNNSKNELAYKVIENIEACSQAIELNKLKIEDIIKHADQHELKSRWDNCKEYSKIQNNDEPRSYELALQLTSDDKSLEIAKKLGINESKMQSKSNQLILAYVLNKAGLGQLTKSLPAVNYVDIMRANANNRNSVYIAEEQELKEFLIEYTEIQIIQVKLMQEKVISKDNSLVEKSNEYSKKMAAMQGKYPNIEKVLDKKFEQGKYNFLNKASHKGGYEAVYQRLIQGKSTSEDYAAFHNKLAQELLKKQSLDLSNGINK